MYRLNMGRYSVSINDDELEEWMEEQHEDGPFRNRSHVVEEALKRMREDDGREVLV